MFSLYEPSILLCKLWTILFAFVTVCCDSWQTCFLFRARTRSLSFSSIHTHKSNGSHRKWWPQCKQIETNHEAAFFSHALATRFSHTHTHTFTLFSLPLFICFDRLLHKAHFLSITSAQHISLLYVLADSTLDSDILLVLIFSLSLPATTRAHTPI